MARFVCVCTGSYQTHFRGCLQPQSWKEPLVDGDAHLASTDNVFATSGQGSSSNTALEILMEQLLFPRQAFKM